MLGTAGEFCGGMYVFMIVVCVLLPVRILIACISVVVSCGGSRDWISALTSVKFMDLWIRVMSPPPLPSARSFLLVV